MSETRWPNSRGWPETRITEAALWAFARTNSFAARCLEAANGGIKAGAIGQWGVQLTRKRRNHNPFCLEHRANQDTPAACASIRATNSQGLTALHYANNAEIARLLIAAGADRTNPTGGETPAETAIRLYHFGALTVITNAPPQTIVEYLPRMPFLTIQ